MRHGTTGRGAALDVYIRATRRAGRTALDAVARASEGGAWSGRRAEVQVPVTWSPDRPGDPLVDE